MTREQMLRDALIALSLPSDAQLEHLTRLGLPSGVDELALEYDGIAATAEDMRQHAELSLVQSEAVRSLNSYLKSFSGAKNSSLWTVKALRSAQQWIEVRRMAKEILGLLGEASA